MRHFKAIAAMAENRIIGAGQRLPWCLPEEMKWFQQATLGQVVIMGRKTYESIGHPLPGRETVVLSRTLASLPGVRVIHRLDDVDLAREERNVFICGGAQVYLEALPRCSDLYLTFIKRTVEGDIPFPPFEGQFALERILTEQPAFQIRHYRNRGLGKAVEPA